MSDVVIIGERVCYAGNSATVRWMGELPHKRGVFLGIEFDEAEGKGSGAYDGLQLFSCSREGAGLFVRPENAQLRKGRAFDTALRERYDRPQAIRKLRHIGLEGHCVCDAEIEPESVPWLKDVTSLDLSRNLFKKLQSVLDIVSLTPELRHLVIDHNTFDHTVLHSQCLTANVGLLSASHTNLDWPQCLNLVQHLGGVEDLRVGFNRFDTLRNSSFVAATLREMNLEGNNLCSWPDITDALGGLPNLSVLLLAGNKLQAVGQRSDTGAFGRLTTLSLRDNLLEDMLSVTHLSESLPGLQHLVLAGNPCLTAMDAKSVRRLIISLFPRLQTLDRSEVHAEMSETERRPGAPLTTQISEQKAPTLASRLIETHLYTPSSAAPLDLRALPSMTIRQLRTRMRVAMRLAVEDMQLVLMRGSDEVGLDDDSMSLDAYGIVAGDVLKLIPS